jgi:hypothetical protein
VSNEAKRAGRKYSQGILHSRLLFKLLFEAVFGLREQQTFRPKEVLSLPKVPHRISRQSGAF